MCVHSPSIIQINVKSSLISHGLNLLHILFNPLLSDALSLAYTLFVNNLSIIQRARFIISHV